MTGGKVRAEDLADRLEGMARDLRQQLADLPAKLAPHDADAALRQRLEAEIETALRRIDEAVLAKTRELRDVQGHG